MKEIFLVIKTVIIAYFCFLILGVCIFIIQDYQERHPSSRQVQSQVPTTEEIRKNMESQSSILVAVEVGFCFALFSLFFSLFVRIMDRAKRYEKDGNYPGLKTEIRDIFYKILKKDRKVVLVLFVVSWVLFSVAFRAVQNDSEWIWQVTRWIDKLENGFNRVLKNGF